MKLYRIKNWDDVYENNRTRELKTLAWVPIPNNHDGDGYTLLVDRKEGAALLGAWLACVQVASKCDPRGTLLRRGGCPHDSASLSRITRLPKEVFDRLLPIAEQECKWLESSTVQEGAGIPQDGATIPQESAQNRTEQNRTEGKYNEKVADSCAQPQTNASEVQKEPEPTAEEIYREYPLKAGKPDALKAIKKAMIKVSPTILLERTKAYTLARNGNLDYVPHPATWFNKERFNDDPSTWKPREANGPVSKPNPRNLNVATDPAQQSRDIVEFFARKEANNAAL
jgi:hypothetical protein